MNFNLHNRHNSKNLFFAVVFVALLLHFILYDNKDWKYQIFGSSKRFCRCFIFNFDIYIQNQSYVYKVYNLSFRKSGRYMKKSKKIKHICIALTVILIFFLFAVRCFFYPAYIVQQSFKSDNYSCGIESSAANDAKSSEYTLLIYMCASSLESKNGAAGADISELLSADIQDNVNVVIETGGTNHWKKHGISTDKLQKYCVKDNKLILLEEYNLSSMGSSYTLTDFINWGTKKFPAKKTALILWDHGGGFLKGICRDELFFDDWLTVQEFDKALKASSFSERFDFIGFDACFMANYETALTASQYTDYLIASEGKEPTSGWDYKQLAQSLGSGDEKQAVLESFAFANKKYDYTLSAINLTKLNKMKYVLMQCADKGKSRFLNALQTADKLEYSSSGQYDIGSTAKLLGVDYDFSDCISVVSSDAEKYAAGISFCFPADDNDELLSYLQSSNNTYYNTFLIINFYSNDNFFKKSSCFVPIVSRSE